LVIGLRVAEVLEAKVALRAVAKYAADRAHWPLALPAALDSHCGTLASVIVVKGLRAAGSAEQGNNQDLVAVLLVVHWVA
jgi:hypothetical protein